MAAEGGALYRGDVRLAYLSLAPCAILLLLLSFFPALVVLDLSLRSVETGESTGPFVGLENYIWALGTPLFGRALLLTNDADAAERMLQDATEKKPVDPLAFSYLADAAERLDHPAVARQALLDYEALRGDEPDDRRTIAFATRLGDLSSRMQDMPAAAAYFLRAAQGSDPALLARAADAQLRAGNVDAAWDTASKAMEKDPANALALSVQRRIARGRS